ncbi:MAG: hypothetical protein R6U64_06090 [Bacteroidales bacterium]
MAMALMAWFFRKIEDLEAQKAITLAFLLSNILGVIISVHGIMSGLIKNGWPVVAIYLFFAVSYAFFHFRKVK